MARLSHVDDAGAARMVDVGGKPDTDRIAVAEGAIAMSSDAFAAIRDDRVAKGDVLAVARVAGIMASKRTADLVPLCHPLALSAVEVALSLDADLPGVRVEARVATRGRTGVEMEAMIAASVALVTVYDMAKAVDPAMTIGNVRLVEKRGGKSGDWRRP